MEKEKRIPLTINCREISFMIVKIYGENYKLNPNTAASAKKVVKQIFDTVRLHASINDLPGFFTAFVIMTYIISASILQELSSENIKNIAERLEDI